MLSPDDPKKDEILNKFFTKINSACNEKKNSVIEYFNEDGNLNTKITLDCFNNVLNNLGYDDQNDDLGVIIKKYQDKFETNYIDLEAIENDLKVFKNRPIHQNIFTENPYNALKQLLDPFASKRKEENVKEKENLDNNNNQNLKENQSEINKNTEQIQNENKIENESSSNLNPYVQIIKEKIENEKKLVNSELNSTPEYQLCLIYNKIYNKCKEGQMINIFENQFYNKDQSLTGYISYTDFINILDNTILLSNKEIEILFNDIDLIKIENEEKKEKNLLKPYKKFLEKIRQNNENQIRIMKYEYNLNYNKYINEMRSDFKNKNIDFRDFWANTFKGNLYCNKNDFYLIFNQNIFSENYHPLEIDYIFELLTNKKEKLLFKTFVEIMNRNVDMNNRELKLINKDKSIYNPIVEDPDEKVYSVIYNKPLNEEEKQIELENKLKNQRNSLISNVTNKIESIIKEKENEKENENENENEKENENENNVPVINNPNIKIIQHNKEILQITNPSNFKQSEIRNGFKYDEIKNLDPQSKMKIIESRINDYLLKVNVILNQHEEYVSLKLIKYLYNNFKNMGNEPNIYMKKKDIRKVGRLSLSDFHYVLSENLHIKNIDLDVLGIILNSLIDKDSSNSFFNYSEFLKKIYHFPFLYEGKESKIYRMGQFNFNEYLLDFKRFIKFNNIDYLKIFNYLWKNNPDLEHFDEKNKKITFNDFILFCSSMTYILSHSNEIKFIFDTISTEENFLKEIDLCEFIDSKILTKEEFINSGKIQKIIDSENDIFNWQQKIPKIGSSSEKFYRNLFRSYNEIFQNIKLQRLKYNIKNFPQFFDNTQEITEKGLIPKDIFLRLLLHIGIFHDEKLDELIIYLEDDFDRNYFKLYEFLSIYYVFCPESEYFDKKLFKRKTTRITLPNTNEVNVFYNKKIKKEDVVYKNKIRSFTQDDIEQITVICKYVAKIIHEEKQMKISDYFTKFDIEKNKYLTLNQLKYIFNFDLEIEIDEDDTMDIFFDFVIDDDENNKEEIVYLNRLLKTMIDYGGSDEPVEVGKTVLDTIQKTVLAQTFNATYGNLQPTVSSYENFGINQNNNETI